jgi:hypothetical protein
MGSLLGAVIVVFGALAPAPAGEAPAAAPRIIHTFKFIGGGDARVHCACVTIRGGCDVKLHLPFAEGTVHQWWQIVQIEAGKPVDVASACWRKRDVPGYGDAYCCSPGIRPDGEPIPRELRNLFGATATREAGEVEPQR